MDDFSSMDVGDIIKRKEDDGAETEYRIIEKETSPAGKLESFIVEPVGEEGTRRRIRVPASEWGDVWIG